MVEPIGKIELFGKEVPLRTHSCSFMGKPGYPLEKPHIDLYIRTKDCNSRCQFCIWHSDAQNFNEKKFHQVFEEIIPKIRIRKIAVTGGEPTLNWKLFENIVSISRHYVGPKTYMSMNTDGLRLQRLFDDPIHQEFNQIHISRHHWDDSLNNEIFNSVTPTAEQLAWAQNTTKSKHQIQLSCNLIKGYIDNKEKMYQYLEFVNSLKINNCGFVSLMPVNEYSKENYIGCNIEDLINERFNVVGFRDYKGACECSNYAYFPEDLRSHIRVYHKNTYEPDKIQETLVFDGENLRLGFGGELVF